MPRNTAAVVPAVQPDAATGSKPAEPRIRTLRSMTELAEARAAWLSLLTDEIAVHPDFYEAALDADERIVRPHVVVLEHGSDVQAMLVARIERLEFGVRAGYRKLYSPKVTAITILQGGLLGTAAEPEVFRVLLGAVRESLAAREADVAIVRYLPLDSELYRIARETPPFLCRQHAHDTEVHWELDLPESLDDLLGGLSSSARQTVKRYSRKLEKEHGDELSVRVFTEPDELDEFFRAIEPVSAKTYQRALGVSFGDTPAYRARTQVSMENGWFRGYVLYLDGRPVAWHHGELFGGRFRHGRPGYDPDLSHLRIGTYLLLKMIDDLCQRPDARIVDYGVGDADYKKRFGTRSTLEGNVVVYAPTPRAVTVNVVRSTLLAAVSVTKRVLKRSDLYGRVKREWRSRLVRSKTS
jgi:CelD/BcsL family acetyltransferase involved in cellulose biosynthesis